MSFEGLAQGARICRKLGIVTNRAAKKMTDVDITFNMMKHMNAIRARDFANEMQEGMILPAGAKKAASEKETNLEEELKNKAAEAKKARTAEARAKVAQEARDAALARAAAATANHKSGDGTAWEDLDDNMA